VVLILTVCCSLSDDAAASKGGKGATRAGEGDAVGETGLAVKMNLVMSKRERCEAIWLQLVDMPDLLTIPDVHMAVCKGRSIECRRAKGVMMVCTQCSAKKMRGDAALFHELRRICSSMHGR
jgi:hypothetical protein